MDLLSLNDDVLLAIFAHLHGEDALNVSLTSKRVYGLAAPRIASHIVCASPEELRRLHAYLLSNIRDGTPRARFLEKLDIDGCTFQGVTEHEQGSYMGNYSQVSLIGDILLRAPNICELSFDKLHPCIERDPRIVDVIRSLASIVKLEVSVIADVSFFIFDSARLLDNLAHLCLAYHYSGYRPLFNQAQSLQPLISLLPSFRHLHTLEIRRLDPKARLSQAARRSMRSLPSIRILRLRDVSTSILDLVDLCPNLSVFTMSLVLEDVEQTVIEGPKWPSLRLLGVDELDDVRLYSTRLRTVDQLQICGQILLNSDTTAMSPKERLLELLRDTSPVGLYMCVKLSGQVEQSCGFWSDMARAAPRLRSLELQLYRPRTPDSWDDYSWVSELPHALCALPLQCLRVLVPPDHHWREPSLDRKAKVTRDQEEEINRVKALIALPPLLVHAFPLLRCLSVGDAAPDMELLEDTPLDPAVSALQVDEEAVEWEWDYLRLVGAVGWGWDELRHLMGIRRQRWWRVVYGPHGRELVEITSEEGEAAQQEIETSGSMTLTEDSMPYH
ncbi:hypothetical protein L226DRAFT_511839 [Lentinus tigrinus ALCF2SS1-7]|uniref:uncharacterized protein n=1 Tax=Lentinus tigrinus ALCF2SS1-7 TaxID=1328758 RepID=UPI001165D5A9|nr:hypothetical protein L226DRAFT_511839 [Lentinus tigrinus ALCF2SS1-7]